MGRPPKGQAIHSEELLKCAQTLLQNGHLVDTMVMTQGKTFKAHGLVLAAYSCYFKSVMTSEEGASNVFVLDNLQLTSAAFKVILDYMYNGVLNVVEEDLKHVEHAATQLQVESAVKLIEKMKYNLERIRQRQLYLEAKMERKRLRRMQKEGRQKLGEEKSSKTVVREDLPQDEDTEDNPIVQTITEEEQLNVIAQAWKAVAEASYPRHEEDTSANLKDTSPNLGSTGDNSELSSKDVTQISEAQNEGENDTTKETDENFCEKQSEREECDNRKDEISNETSESTDNCSETVTQDTSSKTDHCPVDDVPVDDVDDQTDSEKTDVENVTDEVDESHETKDENENKMATRKESDKKLVNDDSQPVPSTSQQVNGAKRITREVKMDFGSLRLTLGSDFDLSKLLDSDDSSLASSSESDNNKEDFRDDPDFNASLEEDIALENDPDFRVQKKAAVRRGYRRVLRKPLRPTRVCKMRKRKGRPRKVVVEETEADALSNDLEEENSEDQIENNLSVKAEPENESETQIKRRRGRPKGSKNKVKTETVSKSLVLAVPKKRGRPPGSGKKESPDTKPNNLNSDKPKRTKTKLLPEENLWSMYDREVNMFQCPECPYRTRTDKVFRLHRRRHTGYKPYPCQYCGKAFIDRKYLVPHERSHTGERPYKCEYCPSAFFDKKHLNRHVKRHTGQRDCLCSECGLAFFDNDTLKRHHTAVHLNIRPFKCDAEGCKYAAKDVSALKEHKQQHSRDAEGILCDLCGKTFINMNGLRIHKISHEVARFQCNHCPFIAHYKHVLRNHCLRLHGVDLEGTPAIKNVKCEECDFMCFTKQERHLHMLKKHLNERPHKCPICDFSTVDKGSLKKHLRTHTGVAAFECVCGKRFAQHSGYVRHYRSHTGEKPYKCSICDKTYADKKSLNTHLYGHANAKPFVCQICGLFSAVRQEHLKKHIVKQHGEEVFEEYKRKGLCRPTLNPHDVEALSANCIVLASDRVEEQNQNATLEELGASPAPSHESPHTDHNQVLIVTSTGQQTSGQHQQQLLMAPQIRVYEEPNMAVSHPMVMFPSTSQTLMGGFTGHHVMDQSLPPQAHMGHHLTTVNLSELTALTPVTPQHIPQQPTPTNLVMQPHTPHHHHQPSQDHHHQQQQQQPMQQQLQQTVAGQPPHQHQMVVSHPQYYSSI